MGIMTGTYIYIYMVQTQKALLKHVHRYAFNFFVPALLGIVFCVSLLQDF